MKENERKQEEVHVAAVRRHEDDGVLGEQRPDLLHLLPIDVDMLEQRFDDLGEEKTRGPNPRHGPIAEGRE